LRVLWVTERFPPDRGGASVSAGRQVAAVADHVERLDVVRLSADAPAGSVREHAFGAARLHEVGRASSPDESLQLLLQACVNLQRAHRHHVVHGFYAVPAGYVAALAAREQGVPSVVSLRGNDVDRAMFSSSRLASLLWTLEHATALCGVSRAILARAQALCPRKGGLHLVPNGVDTAVFRPGVPLRDVPRALAGAPRPWLAFSGELRLKKGMPVLLALAERLAQAQTGTLVAIGGVRDEERAGLAAWRRANTLAAPRLVELPYLRDPELLAGLYGAMDLFVFPSLWEGLPNAALEAMACARPVLATLVGGFPDLVEDEVSGWLVEATDLDRFADEAERLAALPAAERDRVGAAARVRVAHRFTVGTERDALLQLWRSLG
jgi:phosphatidylinositol alpha-1,6-mannosyltransferase